MAKHQFGGDWTERKLKSVRDYLVAYLKVLKNFRAYFSLTYIDAFAGTGYRQLKHEENPEELLLPELVEEEPRKFFDGSARIALGVKPSFDRYIFVETLATRAVELEKLKSEFPDLKERIQVVQQDANSFLQEWCNNTEWTRNRAVLFLDPYGMQVSWKTVEAIAGTKSIDMWYLFPLNAVIRLLRKDGTISLSHRKRLDEVLGESDWYDAFYKITQKQSLFGEEFETQREDYSVVAQYLGKHLMTVFQDVAKNPLVLRNSKNSPLYLLCFAVGNERGADKAIRIAQHILDG